MFSLGSPAPLFSLSSIMFHSQRCAKTLLPSVNSCIYVPSLFPLFFCSVFAFMHEQISHCQLLLASPENVLLFRRFDKEHNPKDFCFIKDGSRPWIKTLLHQHTSLKSRLESPTTDPIRIHIISTTNTIHYHVFSHPKHQRKQPHFSAPSP